MTDLSDVKGVGPAIAVQLAEQGITSAAGLASAAPETLTAIPRVGPARALMLIAAARDLADPAPEPAAEEIPAPKAKLGKKAAKPKKAQKAAEKTPGKGDKKKSAKKSGKADKADKKKTKAEKTKKKNKSAKDKPKKAKKKGK